MSREPQHKEIWCIHAFGNNLWIVRGDLVTKVGGVNYVDWLSSAEPDIHFYNDCWCADTELGAYKLLHDYLTNLDAQVMRKIEQLETANG